MNLNLFGAMFLIGIVASGCSKPRFLYDVPPGASVAKFETIALDPRTDYAFIFGGKRQFRDPEVQGLVLAELQARGYRLVPPDQADLWVNAVLLIPAPQSTAGYGGSHGGGTGLGHGGMSHGGHSGGHDAGGQGGGSGHSGHGDTTVLVQLVTRPSLERVWYGTGVVAPVKDASGHHGQQPLPDTVKRLLEPLQARPVATD